MITTLKYTNKVFALTLLLAVLINITVPGILPSLHVEAKPASVEAANCVLYPMAFSSQLFTNAKAGSNVEINAVDQPGSFGWLTWTGNPNANLLAASLTPPGNSSTYISPDNPLDKVVSTGDWVKGVPGVVNSSAVGDALKLATNTSVVVPLFDATRGDGSNRAFKVAAFARVKLVNYEFPKGNHITLEYLGNACETVSLKVSKTVDSATISQSLNASLSVDKEFAIPGDTLTYTTAITETTSDLTVKGTISITNSGDSQVKIAYFSDLIDFQSTSTGTWTKLAGVSSKIDGYTPVTPVSLQTGMTFTAEGVPATGVTYGTGVAGTTLSGGSTATWKYTAVLPSSEVLSQLQDSSVVSQVRNSVHFEVTASTSSGALTYDMSVDFTKSLQSQVSASSAVTAVLTLPDGSTVEPSFSAFASGGSNTTETLYKVPALAGRGSDETEQAYLDRLSLADGSELKARLEVTTETGSVLQSAVSTVLQLPIVTIQKDGPLSVELSQTVSYNLLLNNAGSAAASGVLVVDLLNLDNGTFGAISGVPGTLAAGGSATAQSTYTLPFPETLDYQLPGFLTDVASVNWLDANGNFYGQFTDFFTSEVVSPYSSMVLTLSPASAGPNLTGSQQALTATLVDQQQNPVSGVKVFFVIEGPNATTLSQVTGADGTAVVSYTGVNNGFDNVKAYVITGLAPLASNTATIHWVTPKFTVTTSVVRGRFFTGSAGGSFAISPNTLPVFEQVFPNLNFNNGDSRTGNIYPEVSGLTNPITDVTANLLGFNAGNIPAHFVDYPAFLGYSTNFSAVFTGQFLVTTAGNFTFSIRSDDGFIFGIGNNAIPCDPKNNAILCSEYYDPQNYPFTPFENYPIMGAYNKGSNADVIRTITVNFPKPGRYPFEIDYTEGGGWKRAFILANNQTNLPITPATSLTITPFTGLTNKIWPIDWVPGTQHTFTAALVDASGLPLAGVPVTFKVRGLNAQEFATVTDSFGKAYFTYASNASGLDYVQAIATVNGEIIAVSGEPTVSW